MLHTVTIEQVAQTRALICEAIDSRKAWELTVPQRNVNSKVDYLNTFRKRVERADAYALGYLATHPVAFEQVFRSHRRSNQAFNIYAMPKTLEIARCLNGGALNPALGGDQMTIAGVVLAINAGTSLESAIAHSLNTYAQASGRTGYSSGGTQSSSSLRALEALGVVKQTGKLGNCQCWGVADAALFARMLDASNGKSVASVTPDMEANAAEESGESDTATGRSKARSAGRKARKARNAAPAATAAVDASEGQEERVIPDAVTMPHDDAGDMIDPLSRRDVADAGNVTFF